METDKFLPGVAQIIPEGFVDIIRRVTPGATVWLVLYFLMGVHRISIEGISVGGFILFLLVSYETGLILDTLVDWVAYGFFTWHAWRNFDPTADEQEIMRDVLNLGAAPVARPKKPRQCRHWQMPGLLQTKVIETNARAAVIVPKLVAEQCLLRNLAGGLFVVVIILALLHQQGVNFATQMLDQHAVALFVSLLVFAVLALVAALHRATRTVIRTLEWFKLAPRIDASGETARSESPLSRVNAAGAGIE
jgi:hypothetical protein